MKLFRALILLSVFGQFRCTTLQEKPQFSLINPSYSGIQFENKIEETDSLNVLLFEYIYNGAGVGIGDFNRDNLPDIFFAGNIVSSKLYLNRDEFHFEDVTDQAQVTTSSWCTGVAVHDFNQDGWMDIYISTIHPNPNRTSPNLLFINKGLNDVGIPVFEESASKAGLSANAYSTQASFLDYDRDGDLDVYLVVNSLEAYPKNNPAGQNTKGMGKSQDKFFRNDSDSSGLHFVDVSQQAGIQTEGWGLGITISDINQDGYPDIYVANDFLSNDHLYINNRDGTFSNQLKNYLKHTEYNGMGADIADINNDGLNDIVVLDMMPDDNLRQKAMFSGINYAKFQLNLSLNYLPQYVRNVLQLNNGNGTFSEIGCLSGIYATDWSWSPLIADFDNDGWRDILITNGYVKDITDLDFVSYHASEGAFGKPEVRKKKLIDALKDLKGVYKANFIYRNNKDLTFIDKTREWGLDQPSYSNGAAYADFDNDGDLDLVMNNIKAPASIYKNNTREKTSEGTGFIELQLIGKDKNKSGLGAKVWVYSQGTMQYAEHTTQRGYKSTVENLVHFGIGQSKAIDSLKIAWPSGAREIISNPAINQRLKVFETEAHNGRAEDLRKDNAPMFIESSHSHGLLFKHQEEDFVDFKQGQSVLIHKFSQSGPITTTGDINNDGLNDLVIGGPSHQGATIVTQKKDGRFTKTVLPAKEEEDEGILLLDIDGDNDLDLFCISGSSEYEPESGFYRHRVYVNDGHGNFQVDTTALGADIKSSGSCISANDFDKDGDLDLFVGGRVVPNRYPETPRSFILENVSHAAGKPKFVPISIPGIDHAGMITGSCWVDFDNDHWDDLVIVGEWMPITFFKNDKGKLRKLTSPEHQLPAELGWWRCIKAADFDHDGDMDFIAGNFGLNSIYTASPKEPISLYAKDFDGNGSIDPIVGRYIQGKEYPVHPRETLTEQIVSLRRILPSYELYGKSSIRDILTPQQLDGAQIYRCDHLASSYIENLGNRNFTLHSLPMDCQISTMNDFVIEDFNKDGNLDVLVIQNDYSLEPLVGRCDAGIGILLLGDGRGNFTKLSPAQSGLAVNGDAKSIIRLTTKNNRALYIVTQNQDSLRVYELRVP